MGVPTSGGTAEVNFFFGLAINAQSENKQAAWEFIKYFFREDFQMGDIFPTMNRYVDAKIEKNMSGISGDKNNTAEEEQVKERIYYLLDNCVGQRYYEEDIYTIVEEEAQGYFAGTKSLEQTVATIQNRVQLYIDEKR